MLEIVKTPLNWQAGEIEDAQTELKLAIKKAFLQGKSKFEIGKIADEIINKLVGSLKSDDLKMKANESLRLFADRIYNFIVNTYGLANGVVIASMLSLIEGTQTAKDIQNVRDFAMKNDIFAYNISEPLDMYSKDYMDLVEKRMSYLAETEAKDDLRSRVTLRNVAEMQVRFERNMENIEQERKRGNNLVWILPHANCSKRCEKWQGKLYSLDGSEGTIDGIRYQPIENAMDVYESTKSGKIYRNGCLSGFNCRHKLEPYKDGNEPDEIPASVVERTRAIEGKQRYLENMTRKWREKALLLDGKESRRKARLKAMQWAEVYKKFSKANGMPYFESRIKVV